MNESKPHLIATLEAHQPFDALEAEHLARTLVFLKKTDEPFSRRTLAGHITASSVIIDTRQAHIALFWHHKLNRWLQPGGHCEPEQDKSTLDAAWRELLEETPLMAEQVWLIQQTPFDIDVHPIPAKEGEAAHLHYDIRYLFQTAFENLPAINWRTLASLATDSDLSLARYAHKLL